MAAGRFDVGRRRSGHYSKKESYQYRNDYRDLDSSQGHDQSIRRRNGHGANSGYIETNDGRDGGGRSRSSVSSRTRRTNAGFSSRSGAGDNEKSKVEDGVLMSSEKKRKFSPIVWDRDDREVRISSKSRLIPKSTSISSPLSLSDSFGKSTNVAADGDAIMYPVATTQLPSLQISPVKTPVEAGSVGNCESEPLPNSPALLSPEQCRRHSKELGQLEEDHIEFWQISKSRWAYEGYSPVEKCSDNAGDMFIRRRVEHHVDLSNSPESGEFRREGSEGSRGNSSASGGQHDLLEPAVRGDYKENQVDNDIMEIDEERDDVAGVSSVDCAVENDEDSCGPQEQASPMLQGCQSLKSKYEIIGKINEGTYGVVYKAVVIKTKEIVALKKVKMGLGRESDGFPISALREINILLSLHHPSIVVVKEVVVDKNDDVFMVMEYMEHDLKGLIKLMKQPFSEKEVRCLMRQLLEGVKYLHDNWVLHRDLKTSNLLLNNGGKLKICDFGMSRQYASPLKPYTPLVVTLWYRAPELLLGAKQYSTAVDMWSVGCIMAELLAKQALFNGKTEIEQLDKIFRILGTPSETIWPGFSNLSGAKFKFVKHPRNTLREKFPPISFQGAPVLSEQGFDLLSQLLTYDPKKRITAEAALKHSWFRGESGEEIQESLARRLTLTCVASHS